MAEMLLLSSVLPPIVEKAASLVLDRAVNQYDIMVNIQSDIRSLKTKLNEVNEILQEAEERQIDNNNGRELLRELVDVGYDARDLLDDFITYATRRTSRSVKFDCFRISFNCFGTRFQLANGIKSVMERLDQIMEQRDIVNIRDSLRKRVSNSESPSRRPRTSYYVDTQRDLFVGREDEKDEILRKLVPHDGNGVLVVPILGVGGVGKTTLAQFIYNDERVKEHYPICNRKWLFVGEKKFNALEIIERIIGESNHQDFVVIQEKLVENLKGDKFLIVLDDVWDLDSNEWKLLFVPLTNVGKGGVIIITTRIREVITATNTQVPTDLKPLSPEGCWKIFESHAFVDGKSSNRPEMEPIGREIVEKLDGLPLAAQVVGSSLLNEPDATWRNFINNWERNLRNNKNKLMAALRWSYKLLPPHLKHCFAFCALFPKDHVFDEKLLVEMWMAHDLIQINGDGRPEDIGTQYFKELTYASLFQCVDGKYVMHDMIHDLALLVSNEEFSSAVGSLSTDQMKKVRHITITDDDEYSINLSLCNSKRILTVFYTVPDNEYSYPSVNKDILFEVFKQSKSLRVLVLCDGAILKIPKCICELKHLRYLDVSETGVKSLPHSLCQLHNLQMLAAPLRAVLPLDIVNIRSLRYVRANLPTCRGVAKLTSLQELSSIHVCRGDNISELGNMQRLHGKLSIKGLWNVTSSKDAAGALMEKKTLIDELELVFHQYSAQVLDALRFQWKLKYSAEPTISEEVLDALGCPPNLTYLQITGYTGVNPPSWMVDGNHKFDKLQTLQLFHCPKLEFLPPLGELTSLKRLSLRSVGVKRLGDEFYGRFTDGKVFFPSLESLSFFYMKEWEEWDDIIIENSSVSFFPRLTELEIYRCEKLVSVLPVVKNPIMNAANFMTSLSSLEISSCNGLKRLQLDALVSLKELNLSFCPELEFLPPLGELTSLKCLSLRSVGVKRLGNEFYGKFTDGKVFFPSLESLSFFDMEEWEEWDDIIIENSSVSFFPRLTLLKIEYCPKLVSVLPVVKNPIMNAANFMTSLSSLEISSCNGLKRLQLDALVSLKELNLSLCVKLESLPPLGELTSLKSLSLRSVGVKRLGDEFYGKFTDGKVFFPSLESLSFFDMKEWEEWDDIIIENSSVSFFPRLTLLKIEYCPKLVSVLPVVKNPIMNAANFMTSLSRLEISACYGLKRLQLDALVSLKELNLSFCPKLEFLPPLGELTSLKRLSLRSVGVKRLGDEFYGKFTDGKVFFPSLESLSFFYMKEWEGWDDIIIENSCMSFFPRLTELEIYGCWKLVSVLPVVKNHIMNGANFMTSLSHLKIRKCFRVALPADGLPPSLRHLTINGCPLLYERCKDESGPDWHKINHIPDKDIS